MPKPKTIKQLKKLADQHWSVYVRQRDANKHGMVRCITCSKVGHWKEFQNGHFVSRKVSSLRYHDENCNAQCVGCNMFKSGEAYEYGIALDLKYGDGTAKRLHKRRHETHKFKAQELLDIIQEAKSNIYE